MEEKPEEPEKKKQAMSCGECKINPSKYKCPGCSLRSCSLQCVNSHKKRTDCTGKRPLTSFVPISQFDDNLLISDYNMLEDVKRIAESAQRTRLKLCGYGYSQFRLPFPLQSLRKAASSRRTKLLLLSNGMSKRQKNKTHYNFAKKLIYWTIEWRFHSTDVVLIDHGVDENSTLSSLIENHLKSGPWNHPLRQFSDQSLESLKLFIRKFPKGPKSPYRQLNLISPIRDQLANIVILEYPVIHVYIPSHTHNFDVIKYTPPTKPVIKEPTHHDNPSSSTIGVTFKEEEIEDGECLDPLVLDLENHTYENRETRRIEQARTGLGCDTRVDTMEEVKNTCGKSCIEQLDEIGDSEFDFDFDPDLIEVYSEELMNSDGIVDFGGELPVPLGLDAGEFLGEEELEEGEIA